jgi:hypothetical protein
MGWKFPQAATILSVIAIGISAISLLLSWLSYDLSKSKDQREVLEKLPAFDVQLRPDGATAAAMTIWIANRGNVNITPLDITAEHSFEAGELYLSSAQQSADRLKTALSLAPMGTIAPKGVGTLKAHIFGATDGKDDRFVTGRAHQRSLDVEFHRSGAGQRSPSPSLEEAKAALVQIADIRIRGGHFGGHLAKWNDG